MRLVLLRATAARQEGRNICGLLSFAWARASGKAARQLPIRWPQRAQVHIRTVPIRGGATARQNGASGEVARHTQQPATGTNHGDEGLPRLLARHQDQDGDSTPHSSTADAEQQDTSRSPIRRVQTYKNVTEDPEQTPTQPDTGIPRACGVTAQENRSDASLAASPHEARHRHHQYQPPQRLAAPYRKVSVGASGPPDAYSAVLTDFDRLLFEADVTSSTGVGKRLIDQPAHSSNFRLWGKLLSFRRRIHGEAGAFAIWNGLRQRGIDLPVEGDEASFLWHQFVAASAEHPELLQGILDYNREFSHTPVKIWPYLYERLILHMLRAHPARAPHLHDQLEGWCPRPPGFLARIVRNSSTSRSVMTAIHAIYLKVRVPKFHDDIVPFLYRRGRYSAAYQWHLFLTHNYDAPQLEYDDLEPVEGVSSIAAGTAEERDTEERAGLTGRDPPSEHSKEDPSKESPTSDTTAEEGTMQERFQRLKNAGFNFSDEFCARCIAAKSVPMEIIIQGMYIFGLRTLGPLALRELAAQEDSPAAVVRRIQMLREMGIMLDSSKFCVLVEKAASEDDGVLLEDLVANEQHPDELEDHALQMQQLEQSLRLNDLRQARKTLAVLATFGGDRRQVEHNLLLQSQLALGNVPGALQVLLRMHETDVPVSTASFGALLDRQQDTATWRRVPHRMRQRARECPRPLALNTLLSVLHCSSGSDFRLRVWRPAIQRLGDAGAFDELEKLLLWLEPFHGTRTAQPARLRVLPARFALRADTVGLGARRRRDERWLSAYLRGLRRAPSVVTNPVWLLRRKQKLVARRAAGKSFIREIKFGWRG